MGAWRSRSFDEESVEDASEADQGRDMSSSVESGSQRQRAHRQLTQGNSTTSSLQPRQELEPDREQRHGEDEGDDQLTIARLLQRLIQSGQVRVVSNGSGAYEESPEDDRLTSPDDSDAGNSSPSAPDMVRRSGRPREQLYVSEEFKSSDITNEVALQSGETLNRNRCALSMLYSRTIGMVRRKCGGSFSHGDKCSLANRFIPNKRRLVERNRTKTFCCHYTNNGDTLLTASQDHMIRLYSTSGKRQRYVPVKQITAPNVGWSILDLVVSPDGRHAIYATWSEYIHQCKIDGEDPDWQAFNLFPPDYRFAVFSIRFSADGSEILAGASDRRLYIYDRQANRQSLSIDAHEDDVNAVCFGDEASNIIYSGADDGLCKVWDRRTLSEERPQPVGVLAGHMDGITFIDSKGDGRHLITNSKDQSIKLWDVRKFSSNEAQEETRTAVSRQSWDYRWHSVPRYARRTSRLEGDTSLMTYRGHTVLHTLIRAHFSPAHVTGQRYIYSGCARGHCIVYDMLTGKIVKKLEGHRSVVRDVSWHPYEMEMTTSSWDGETAVWRWDQRAKRNFDVETAGDATMSDEDSCDEEYNRVRGRKRGTAAVAGVSDDDNGTSQGANRSRSRRGRWSASQTNMTSSSATSTGIIPSTDGTLDEAAGNDDRTALNIELDDSELEDVEAAAAEILKRSLSRDE